MIRKNIRDNTPVDCAELHRAERPKTTTQCRAQQFIFYVWPPCCDVLQLVGCANRTSVHALAQQVTLLRETWPNNCNIMQYLQMLHAKF